MDTEALKSESFIYLYPEILFRFQWQMHKICFELGLGPGFGLGLTSPHPAKIRLDEGVFKAS